MFHKLSPINKYLNVGLLLISLTFIFTFNTVSNAQCPTEVKILSNGSDLSPALSSGFTLDVCDQADDLLIELQIVGPTGQSYTINWGDGSTQGINNTTGQINVAHIYTSEGDYALKISPGASGATCLSGNLKIARKSFVNPQFENVTNGLACPDGSGQFQLDLKVNHPRLSSNEQYTIDWGDGTFKNVKSSDFDINQGFTAFNHTYNGLMPGDEFSVTITGANSFLNTCPPIITPATQTLKFQEEPDPDFTVSGDVCENGGIISLERTTIFDYPFSEGTYQWEIVNVTDANTIFTFPFDQITTLDPDFSGIKEKFEFVIEDADIDQMDNLVVRLVERNSCSPGIVLEKDIQVNAVPNTSINNVNGQSPGPNPISFCIQDLQIELDDYDPTFDYAWTLVNGHGIIDPPSSINNSATSNPIFIPANQLTTGNRTLFISVKDNTSGQSCEKIIAVELNIRQSITPSFTLDDDLDDDGSADDNCGSITFELQHANTGLQMGDEIKFQFSKNANFNNIVGGETVNQTFDGNLEVINKTLDYFGNREEAIWYIRSQIETTEGCKYTSSIEPIVVKRQPKELNFFVQLVNGESPSAKQQNFEFCVGDRVSVQVSGTASNNSVFNWTTPAGATLDDTTPNNSALVFIVSAASDGATIEVEEDLNGCSFTSQSNPIKVNEVPDNISVAISSTGNSTGDVCFDDDGSITFSVQNALGDVSVDFSVNGSSTNISGTPPLIYGDDPAEPLLQNITADANILIASATTTTGCPITIDNANATLNVLDPVYNLSLNNTTACANENIEMKVDVNGGVGPYNITIGNDKGLPDIVLTGYTVGTGIPVTVPNTPQDIVYEITAINDATTGCTPRPGSTPSVALKVNEFSPKPSINTSHSDAVCFGTKVVLTSDLTVSGATYRWLDNGGGIVQENASPELNRDAAQDEEYRVSVITAEGCASAFSDPQKVEIIALPATPSITVTNGSADFCDDNATSVTLSASAIAAGESYQWLKNGSIIANTSQTLVLDDVSESGDYAVQIIGQGATACESTISDDLAVTIKNIPGAPVLTGEMTLCAGVDDEFYFVAPITGATYNWDIPAAVTPVLGGAPEDPFVQLAFPNAGNYSLAISATVNGCTGSESDLKIEVLDPTNTSSITGTTTLCEGDNETYSVVNTPGSTYQWSVPSGSFITSGGTTNQISVSFGSGTAAGPNPEISVIETNVAGCASTQVIKNVSVNNLPTANIVGNLATICEGDEFDLEVAWTGDLPITVNYLVDGTTTGNFTIPTGTTGNYFHDFEPDPTQTTIYTLTSVTDGNACASNATGLIRVNVDPVPELELGANKSIPQGSNITIIPDELKGTYSNIAWVANPASAGSFDNPNSDNPTFIPNPAFTGAITISATISDSGPCADVNDSFILNVNPAGAIIAGNDLTVCENSGAISFLDATRDIDDKYDQYTWSSAPAGSFSVTTVNDPSSDDDLHTVFTPTSGTGTYTITLSAVDFNDGLPNTSSSFLLVINDQPTATLITTTEQIICEGDNADLSVQLTGNAPGSQWTLVWEDDNGATGTVTANASPYTFSVPGTTGETRTYTIVSVSENDGAVCTNTAITGSVDVTKRALPSAKIVTDDYEVCAGDPTEITIELTGNGPWNVKWSADGGVTENIIPSIITSPHTFSVSPAVGSATSYELTEVTEQNGTSCSAAVTGEEITITNNALPTVVLSGNTTICEGQTADITFDFTGTGPWSVTYNDGNADITIDNIATSPYVETVTPAANTTYTLASVRDANSCESTGLTQSVVVQVNPVPTVDVGTDRSLPVNSVVNLVPTLSGSFTTVKWDDGGAGGVFNNPNTANTNYTPPTGFVGTIDLTLTLSDGSGPCDDDISDQLTVTYNAAGTVNPGVSGEVCNGGTVTLDGAQLATDYERYLWSADRPGTFTPATIDNPANEDALHTDFFPSNGPGTYVVTLTVVDLDGVLPDATGTLTVTVNPLPTASISGATTICEGQTADLTFDFTGTGPWSVTYNDGTADITIDNIATSPYVETVTPAANTTYTLASVRDANSCESTGLTQSVVVQVNKLAQVNPEFSSDLCTGEQIQINGNPFGGSGIYNKHTWQGSGAAYLNNTDVPNPVFQVDVDQPTSFELVYQVTDQNTCVTTASPLNFTIYPKPVINFSESQLEVCAGQVISLDPEVTGGDGNYDHQWTGSGSSFLSDTGIETPEFSAVVDEPNKFILVYQVKDGNSCQAVDNIEISVLPAVVVEAIDNKDLCQGESVLLSANISGEYSSLLWESDQGAFDSPDELNTFFTASDEVTGEVAVNVTAISEGAVCSESTTSFTVDVKEKIMVNAGSDLSVCQNEPVAITANVSGNYSNLEWTTSGSGNLSNEIQPQVNYQPMEDEIGVVTFFLTARDGSGLCPIAEDEVTVNFNPAPEFDLQSAPVWCEEDLITIDGTVSGTFSDLLWSSSGNGAFTNPNTASTTYIPEENELGEVTLTLQSTDETGSCPDFSGTVAVTLVPRPKVNAGANLTINEGETATLSPSISGTFDRLEWSTSGNGEFVSDEVSTTYIPVEDEEGEIVLTLTAFDDSDLCDNASDQVILTIIPKVPTAQFSVSQIEGCIPLEVSFLNESIDADSYEWDFGDNSNNVFSTDAAHIYNQPGTYTASLTALNAAGRQDQYTVVIQVYDLPVAGFSIDPLEYFMPDPLRIVNASQGATAYLWNFGDGNTSVEFEPEYVYEEPGTYEVSLMVENEVGCEDEFFLEEPVVIKEGGTIIIPTAFTPSMTGSAEGRIIDVNANDVFLPVTTGVNQFTMKIFNRWGSQVFASDDANIGWNGFIGSELAPSGTYVYQIQIQFSDGNTVNKTGNVTLIR